MYNKRHDELMLLAQGTDRILRSGASLVMLVTQLVIALVLSPVLTVLVLVLIAGRSIRAISYQFLALLEARGGRRTGPPATVSVPELGSKPDKAPAHHCDLTLTVRSFADDWCMLRGKTADAG